MVAFQNTAAGKPLDNWWDNGKNQIAFSRGNRAFIAINNDDVVLGARLYTGLPESSYCDVISGESTSAGCSGLTIHVDGFGKASFGIYNGALDPMVAIHIGKAE